MSARGKSVAIFTISLLLFLSISGQLSCEQEGMAKRVLVLNSYSRGFLWTDNTVKGIESVMGSEEDAIELMIEYMDTKSVKYDARYKAKLYDLYKYKYGNQTFDLIMSTDDNAFDFLREYREDLFPGAPVVFCGVNNLEAPNLVDRDVFTGVIEISSVKETIDIALSLHPETREIIFVADSTPTGTQLWSHIQGLSGYYGNVRMTRIDDSLSMEQIEYDLSRLPDDTIVIFVTLNRDNSGKYYSSKEAVPRVCRASVQPVYGCSVQVLPHGIVGGELIGGVYHGQVTATMAKRILAGDAVRDIPVITEPQTETMFDYNQMQRWGIKESDLPEDSIIVNKPYSFYEENKGLIGGIIAFMVVQTLIIVALVVNRSRRKAAENELKESEDRFRTIFDSINDAVVIHDIETGAILNVNNKTCNMYGYTREELRRLDVQTISMGEAPYARADSVEWMKKAVAGEPQVFEWRAKHKSGRLFWVEVSMRSAVVGGRERLLVVARDITERKHLGERMAHLNLVLRAIRNVNQLITKEHDRDRLLQGACDNLIETRGYHNAWIALLDHSGTLLTTAEAGLGEAFTPVVKRLEHGELIECGKKALTQSGVVVIDDPISACRGCPLAEMHEDRRAMTARLEYGGAVYGIFSVAVPAKLAADGEEQALFKEVAEDIAFAMYNLEQEEKRKQAEEELTESLQRERFWADIVRNASVGVAIGYPDGHLGMSNVAYQKITGYSEKELQTIDWNKILTPPEWGESETAKLQELHRTKKSVQYEKEYIRKDGSRVPVELLVHPRFDSDGNVECYFAFVIDITDRKQSEEELRLHAAMMDNVAEGVYLIGLDDLLIKWTNEKFTRMFCYDPGEMVGKHVDIVNAPTERTPTETRISLVNVLRETGEWHGEVRNIKRGGTHFWCYANVSLFDHPEYGKVIVSAHTDITERKQAEEALRESEEKYRALFETAKDAIFLSDWAGKFVDVNSAACLSLGYDRDELLKMSNKEIDADPRGYETFTKLRDGLMKEAVFEVNQKRKDGTLVPVEISGKFIESDGSKIFLAIARDITARKQDEMKLEQTMSDLKRSNNDLEQFAYVVSHDLQEPLRMVSSYMQLLSKRYKDKLDSDADDFIGFAVDGASRMQSLIRDLLKYSRVGTRGKPLTPVACEDALNQALANLKLTIEDSGAVVTHDPLPTVLADSSQLVQLFQNLIGNAIKFKGEEPPRVHIAAEQKEGKWVFSVADNGIGISPEFFDRIFVIFQRLHGRDEYSGTGIGLAICRKIVDRHGGRMWVESEPGQGATFYFTIPAKGRRR